MVGRYILLSTIIFCLITLVLLAAHTRVKFTALHKEPMKAHSTNIRPSPPLPYCYYNISKPKPLTVDKTVPSWNELEKRFTMLHIGGHYRPTGCQAVQSTAIIIPYRNRETHLKLFLQHMHPFLQAQRLEYTIYVVELDQGGLFKKTVLMNAGFLEISKWREYSCIVFHDVDMVPMDAMLSYSCIKDTVRHPARFVNQFKNLTAYDGYFGGVLIFPTDIFRKVNGFSNIYQGWGGEDDDMYSRVLSQNIAIDEPDNEQLWYESWPHSREPELINRKLLVQTAAIRMELDGLQSANYTILQVDKKPLYTRIFVSAKAAPSKYYYFKPQTNVTVRGGSQHNYILAT